MRITLRRLTHLTVLPALLTVLTLLLSPTLAHAACGTIKNQPGTTNTTCLVGWIYNPTYVACNNNNFGSPCCVGANATTECQAFPNATATPAPTPTGPVIDPLDPPTDEFFDLVDPLQHGGGKTILDDVASPFAAQLKTPGGIISRLLFFAFPLAGLILFVMLVWAGFEILIGAPTKKSIDAGKQRATAALVGFLLLFATYWIFQIIEVVFGVKIL